MQPASPAAPAPGAVFLRYWLPVLAYAGVIFSLSSLHSTGPTLFRWQDKLEHFLEYGLFGFLLWRAFRFSPVGTSGVLRVLGAGAAGSLVGAADEIYQRGVSGRVSDVRDWATDTAALFAVALVGQLFSGGVRRARPRGAPEARGAKEDAG